MCKKCHQDVHSIHQNYLLMDIYQTNDGIELKFTRNTDIEPPPYQELETQELETQELETTSEKSNK